MKIRKPVRTVVARSAVAQAVTAALAYGHAGLAAAATPVLPVPCYAGTCAPGTTPGFSTKLPNGTLSGPSGFVTLGSATATQNGNTLTVNQATDQAILNWASFDIGAGGAVRFNQPSSTSVALNKIYSSSPSSIFGALSANGQVWLINPNGFVFGSTATVNVAGLMASSLGMYNGDDQFSSGLTSPTVSNRPALESDGRIYVTDADGKLVLDATGQPQQVSVVVQQGASLTATDSGRILLAGQTVANSGTLTAADGQVILAAGQAVYLQSSSDSSLRGLVVEVNNTAVDSSGNAVSAPTGTAGARPDVPVGMATNQAVGQISTPRGNVSLMGLAVNQSGRISATTSVSANGSVVLTAGQGSAPGIGGALATTQGGALNVASSSDIEILPEIADTTTTAAVAQPQLASVVRLTGQAVYLDGGAIEAPGGTLSVVAAANPSLGMQNEGNTAAQIRVGAGTTIDLAGTTTDLPMSYNLTSLQLFSSELADDPDQRDGALHGQTVVVDTRNGRPAIISESSWQGVLQGLQEDVAQRTAAGGSASFQSEGDVVLANGASLDVSGGAWNFASGTVQTSQLIGADGHTYSIASANPSLTYTGVLNPTWTKSYAGFGVQVTGTTPGLSHIEAGYTEGFSAGTVSVAAPALVMQATLTGTAVNGAYQRSAASIPASSLAAVVANGGTIPTSGAVALASGGTLRIGGVLEATQADALPNLYAPGVTFTDHATPMNIADGAALPVQTLQLPVDYLARGFQSTQIFSDGTVTVPAGLPLDLGAGGSLAVVAPSIRIGSDILAAGGSITLESMASRSWVSTGKRLGISVADDVTLDVSGRWTNDSPLVSRTPQGEAWQDGGSITLSLTASSTSLPAAMASSALSSAAALSSGGELTLGDGVSLLADGGAWLKAGSTGVSGGKGGSMTLGAGPDQAGLLVGTGVKLSAFGVQGAAGGSFTLQAPRIRVQNGGSWADAQSVDTSEDEDQGFVTLGSALFSDYGFSNISLTATGLPVAGEASNDVLDVVTGTVINAAAQSLQVSGGYTSRASGGSVRSFAQPVLLPVASQTPLQLTFQSKLTDTYVGDRVLMGDVDIEAGASIQVAAGTTGAITLASQGSVHEDGTLRAPGGSLVVEVTTPSTVNDPGYVAGQGIDLGSGSVLDVSGVFVAKPNGLNLPLGTLLAGGSITLQAQRGDIVAHGVGTDCAPDQDCGGSVIDIAGTSAQVATQNSGASSSYTVIQEGSAGGELVIKSGQSVSLLGTLLAAAGQGAADQGTLQGGSLELDLRAARSTTSTDPLVPLFAGPFSIQLVQSVGAGTSPSPEFSGSAVLGIDQLKQSGIDSLTLSAGSQYVDASGTAVVGGSINFSTGGSTTLSMGRQIVLDAPVIATNNGTQATVTAPYVVLKDTQQIPTDQAASTPNIGFGASGSVSISGGSSGEQAAVHASTVSATGGSGSLSVNAQEIALGGYNWIQGAGTVTLNAVDDVQADAVNVLQYAGALNVAGNLNITAARIYPATLADYALNSSGTVALARTAATQATTPSVPLSVGGTLAINAANINDDGALLAPFGSISLMAADQLTLGSHSYTSVSADGITLPFGMTTYGGQEWVYSVNGTTAPITSVDALTSALGASGDSARTVTLSASAVELRDGATVDISGGGDLQAYEWVPGLGGSKDALGQILAAANDLYAIVPSSGAYAAYDLQEFTGSNASVGQSVYLSGGSGLAAGFYTLLPARYALLPGAYLVQMQSQYTSTVAGLLGKLADGTSVVAGYLTSGNGSTGLGSATANTGMRTTSGYTGFALYPGSYAQQLAAYSLTSGTTYFAAAVADTNTAITLPADAGTLALAVGSTLALDQGSTVHTLPATDGVAGTVEIYSTAGGTGALANSIYVGDVAAAPEGAVAIDASGLKSWDAGTVLLGGRRQHDGSIDVSAGTVEFGAGGSTRSAGEILAVATSAITVDAGATLGTTGAVGDIQTRPVMLTSNGAASNSAALLAVSNNTLDVVQRTAAPASGATITLKGATLDTAGAVTLDAAGITVSDDSVIAQTGASIALASSRIGFTAADTTTGAAAADTLVIDSNMAGQLNQAGALRIASGGAIDLLGSVALGGSGMKSLVLAGSAINNNAGSASFTAQTIILQGNGTAAPAQSVTPVAGLASQTLAFNAGEIDFGGMVSVPASATDTATAGAGTLAINNLATTASTTFNASGSIVAQGTGTVAVNGGDVILKAAQVTATSGSAATLTVSAGNLDVQQEGSATDVSQLASSLGGGISLSARSITDTGSIVVAGGRIGLAATAGDLTVGPGAMVDVSGITVTVEDQVRGAAGGIVNLGATGDLNLAQGSRISVEGALSSADGYLNLTAGGTATVGSTLTGSAAAGTSGASFTLNAGQLAGGLQSLAPALAGFGREISVEVAHGDLDLARSQSLSANQVTLTADGGAIDIAGAIKATSADTRGFIGLFANGDVTLEGSGALRATASTSNADSSGRGGTIELSTVTGTINLPASNTAANGIFTTGAEQAGTLILRAPTVNGNDMAVSSLQAGLHGVDQVVLEPVLQTSDYAAYGFDGTPSGDFTDINVLDNITHTVNGYVEAASGVLSARLGAQGSAQGASLLIKPAVVVDETAATQTLSNDVALAHTSDLWLIDYPLEAPVDLTVRAMGNLNIYGSFSDGIFLPNIISSDALFANTPSSSFHFVAGANLSSANPLGVTTGSGATLTLGRATASAGSGTIITTDTGDIDLVSAGNVIINKYSGAFTTGAAPEGDATHTVPGAGDITYLTGGGQVSLRAGGDITAALYQGNASAWLAHDRVDSNGNQVGVWGVNLTAYAINPWSVAALGGGDVRVSAGGNITTLSAAASGAMSASDTAQTLHASGGLDVQAGGNITSGQFLLGEGSGTLSAGQAFATSPLSLIGLPVPLQVGSLFDLQDAKLSLWAQDGIDISAIASPTALPQSNAVSSAASVAFLSYGADSGVSAQTSAGNIVVNDTQAVTRYFTGVLPGADAVNSATAYALLPGTLNLAALAGDITLADASLGNTTLTLSPSASGQYDLFAARDIVGGQVFISDAPAASVPTTNNLNSNNPLADLQILAQASTLSDFNFNAGWHEGGEPASIVAGRDITGARLSLPEPARIEAGRDIVSLDYYGQNFSDTDLTLISAGRDITYPLTYTSSGLATTPTQIITVGGPGSVDLVAGRDINLGFANGVTTTGNLSNANLSATGASINMIMGVGQQQPDYTAFLDKVVVPSQAYTDWLVAYVESITGQEGLTTNQAMAEFGSTVSSTTGSGAGVRLTAEQQQAFIDEVFFQELNLSGKEANEGLGYTRGYTAIATLFPGTPTALGETARNAFRGDLDMIYSQIYTESGGHITLVVPGGEINVGVANAPAGGTTKSPNQLGIVTANGGDVDIYALRDVNVNSSRIFGIGGGNVLIWSQLGSIDAGNGAKSSLSLPPPTVSYDVNGNPYVAFNSSVAGSGIRTIQTGAGQAAGSVNLIAPVGTVDAGDAGIGAAGDINIAAAAVVGATNINFGGTATGVPAVVSDVTASVSGAAAAASGATTSASSALEQAGSKAQQAPQAAAALSWLDVFVTGMGESNCKPDDAECLQKEATR